MQILLVRSSYKIEKMDLSQPYIPLNFQTDLDHCLDTKIISKIRIFHLLNIMCLGGGLHSLSALVDTMLHVVVGIVWIQKPPLLNVLQKES